MTREELQALVEILNRTPVTIAERIFLRELVARLDAQIAEAETAQSTSTNGI